MFYMKKLHQPIFQNIAVDACNGDIASLTGYVGEFGTGGTEYKNNEKCQWTIQVDEGMVRKSNNLHIVTCVPESNIQYYGSNIKWFNTHQCSCPNKANRSSGDHLGLSISSH